MFPVREAFKRLLSFLAHMQEFSGFFFLNKLKPIARSLKFGVLANLLGLAYR